MPAVAAFLAKLVAGPARLAAGWILTLLIEKAGTRIRDVLEQRRHERETKRLIAAAKVAASEEEQQRAFDALYNHLRK